MLGAREGSPRAPIATSLCLAAQAVWRSTTLLPRIMHRWQHKVSVKVKTRRRLWHFHLILSRRGGRAQGPEEMCLSLEHVKTRRKPLEKWVILIALQYRYTFYRPQTKRLRAEGSVPRSPFGRRAVRQRGYGLRLLIFKSRSGSDKKRRNRLQ